MKICIAGENNIAVDYLEYLVYIAWARCGFTYANRALK